MYSIVGCRGEPCRLHEQFLPGLLAAEQFRGFGDRVVEPEGREPDGGVGDSAVRRERHGRARGADGPVTHPAFDLLVGAAGPGADRETEFTQ